MFIDYYFKRQLLKNMKQSFNIHINEKNCPNTIEEDQENDEVWVDYVE